MPAAREMLAVRVGVEEAGVARRDGRIAGCGAFRPLADVDYANACEMKRLYVRPDWQRRGVGRMLLAALVERARGQGVHALLAWIEAENAASIELHRAFGFDLVGVQREVGAKFGRWLSLALMECRLD